jgi:hypothetical protein
LRRLEDALRRIVIVLACLSAFIATPHAFADDEAPPPESAEPVEPTVAPVVEEAAVVAEKPVSAADVADAPHPKQADGVAIGEPDSIGVSLLWVPRILLFVPRWTLEVIDAPIRGGAYLYERYQLRERAKGIFFNDEGTVGLYPVALVETGFGLNAGVRFVHRDLLGRGEQLGLRASYGGRFRQIYSGKLSTGGRANFELEGGFEVRPKDRFFGIGNGDEVDASDVMPGIDALNDDTAVATRYGVNVTRIAAGLDFNLGGNFYGKFLAALLFRKFEEGEASGDDLLENVYDPTTVVGYEDGVNNAYTELELRYDSRRPHSTYFSEATPSAGWLVSGFMGYSPGISDNARDFEYVRYGVDVQRYINLSRGARTLIVRGFAETVSADLDNVPFTDLPTLGGALLLRGYPLNRFRDRALTMASVEYQWEVGRLFSGIAFVDSGRVWRSLGDIGDDFDFGDLRTGFGVGLQLHTTVNFLTRFHVASSVDGGLFFNLSFDPVYDTRSRLEEK